MGSRSFFLALPIPFRPHGRAQRCSTRPPRSSRCACIASITLSLSLALTVSVCCMYASSSFNFMYTNESELSFQLLHSGVQREGRSDDVRDPREAAGALALLACHTHTIVSE